MCTICGCGPAADPAGGTETPAAGARHAHDHDRGQGHDHDHGHGPHNHHNAHHPDAHRHEPAAAGRTDGGARRLIAVEQDILAENDRIARRNRVWLQARSISAVNLMSAPGSGKTTLLARTIADLRARLPVAVPIAVIEGDQETSVDAERIRAAGAAAVQINTGKGCHLDARMVERALPALAPAAGSVLFIENVGNLVCPAAFDLGEGARAVLLSVTEGDDKPLKYPNMFAAADLLLLTKIDLLPYVPFDVERCRSAARRVNPSLEILGVSALTGEGLEGWYAWLERRRGTGAAGDPASGSVRPASAAERIRMAAFPR